MMGGSSWLWICTRIPTSNRVSSVGEEGPEAWVPGAPSVVVPLPRTMVSQPHLPPLTRKGCFRYHPSTSSPPQSSALHRCSPHPASYVCSHTHVLPHGQILILLYVQHDLQPIACAALGGGKKLCPVGTRVESVALTHPGEDLGVGRQVQTLPGNRKPSQANSHGTSPLPILYFSPFEH